MSSIFEHVDDDGVVVVEAVFDYCVHSSVIYPENQWNGHDDDDDNDDDENDYEDEDGADGLTQQDIEMYLRSM